ncbi:uncharacterized protein LOC111025679 [Momordica charantia]|uniref:Uncharacterized protein LOC111025679 n=1 Tax=Momordica charantia TaxID=3673 RepID=A0A6J1E1Y2_MOMCH|nr:uncharacterized protein LOC111025679 [Momordica charantia]
MLVSRPLSLFRRSPSNLSVPGADAPYSGLFVVTDEEAEAEDSFCWGICRRRKIKKPPFPTDRILTILHSSSQYEDTKSTKVWLVPVLDRPLSSNRYYVIKARGKHKGKAYRCSREDDITTCCFGDVLSDKKPIPFNLKDIYQQFQIHRHHGGGFFAQAVAPDGVPPKFLRTKGWKMRSSSSLHLPFEEALGLDSSRRQLLPDFDFPIFTTRSPSVVIGKWYCPFVFVRENSVSIRTQMKRSPIYSLTLEQCWEEIFSCESANAETSSVVTVAVDVVREAVLVAGREAEREEGDRHRKGFVWFKVSNRSDGGGKAMAVGLSVALVEKMRWVQEAGGWFGGGENGGEKVVRVEKVEEIRSENEWRRFSLYMLVESFVLRRLNGGLLWKYNFRHTHTIKCKWE